ncbi:UDP-glycosyltransferase 73C6-like [Senna tora]|uniref:Glycosyltransferase n=1 Tax=Senna tora TaxID=362788 RepID=A0A834TD17_9FABA|nr:UDP-glycosyltransferase 73C6-like [Senna tora]
MASQEPHLHFVLFPMMAQGHMIPMIDIARILAQRNIIITIVTTPKNAARFSPILARSLESGLQIRLIQLPLPCEEAGIPNGCENVDMLPSLGTVVSFLEATNMLEEAVEKLFEELTPRPSCIISDMYNITTESEYFAVPSIPHQIEITKAQAMIMKVDERWKAFIGKVNAAAEMATFGIITNSFEELEGEYAREYKKVMKDKMWCIGPVSLCNKDELDKAQRGNNNTCTNECMEWLDLQKPKSVVYACLGSVCNVTSSQLIQLGLALEESNRPFIWVVREGSETEDLKSWIREDGFEERTKARGIVIIGWAPQVLILSHPAIGGFITHCGWNSTIEAICGGVPMVTWPLFGDQFFNEKLVVQILEVGVRVGVESAMTWGEEKEIGVVVKKEDIERAIEELMGDRKEGHTETETAYSVERNPGDVEFGGDVDAKCLVIRRSSNPYPLKIVKKEQKLQRNEMRYVGLLQQ